VKPLCIDLFCGLGGWTEGFLAEGYRVVGFDNERHRYPARAVPESDGTKTGGDWSAYGKPSSTRGNPAERHTSQRRGEARSRELVLGLLTILNIVSPQTVQYDGLVRKFFLD